MYAYVDGNRCTHEGNEGNMEEKKIGECQLGPKKLALSRPAQAPVVHNQSRCISGPYGVDMYRPAQLVSDFIEASRNLFSLKRQPKIFEN
jgi:hypothetical protein